MNPTDRLRAAQTRQEGTNVPRILHKFLVGLAAVLPIGLTTACGGTESDAAVVEAPYSATIDAPTAQIGACIDGSDSNDPAQVTAANDQLAAAMRALTPFAPTSEGARSPEVGIDLVVRQVSAASFATAEDQLLAVQVPAVEGLVEPPDPADYKTYADRNAEWASASAQVESLATQAASAREDMLDSLAALRPGSGGSEIAGCLTALRDSFPPSTRMVAVLVTDLEQVGTPQIRGDYSQIDVVVAHTCATAERCDATEADWRPVFDQLGVASVVFTPVGQLQDQLIPLLEVQ